MASNLKPAAYAVLASQIAVCAASAALIAPATPLQTPDLKARMAYVANSAGAWMAAWAVIAVGAMLLVWFAFELNRAISPDGNSRLASIGMVLVAAGSTIQLCAAGFAAVMMPELARNLDNFPFESVQKMIQTVSASAANGLVTIGLLLLVLALGKLDTAKGAVTVGYAAVAIGLLQAIAPALGVPVVVVATMALTGVGLAAFAVMSARADLGAAATA